MRADGKRISVGSPTAREGMIGERPSLTVGLLTRCSARALSYTSCLDIARCRKLAPLTDSYRVSHQTCRPIDFFHVPLNNRLGNSFSLVFRERNWTTKPLS